MRHSSYRYNPETCQYEPATIPVRATIVYWLGVLFMAALMFIGIAVVFDRFTESKLEAALQKENEALDKHEVILTSRLVDIEKTLDGLKEKDQNLHKKLFDETSMEVTTSSSIDKKDILLADASTFENILDDLTAKSNSLHTKSVATNQRFDQKLDLSAKDLDLLKSIPTLQPIANPNLELLVSGFGVRINPFHKGKYKHPGIDFVAPRGTEVYATAEGRVVDINKSDLQAGYGNSVDIDHGHGFITRYAHLESIEVHVGERVTKKMIIGTVGNSGGSMAPHLHYEVIHNNDNVDPMTYMVEGLNSYEYNQLISLSKKQNQSLD
jgi:murein DD-endopeptidase MepM/ murein hydrolase activator NlpD